MSKSTHRANRGDWRRRALKDHHCTPGDPGHDVRWGSPEHRSIKAQGEIITSVAGGIGSRIGP
jgi:hypothetical protein